MQTVRVTLDDQTAESLAALEHQFGCSQQDLLQTAITAYVRDAERDQRERAEDAQRWQDCLAENNGIHHDTLTPWLLSIGTDHELPCPV